MPLPFFDNSPDCGDGSLYRVDVLYGLDFDEFSPQDWEELERIYRTLPGEIRLRQVPYRFGDDEKAPPYLYASVEAFGLQVAGELHPEDFMAWDTTFRASIEAAKLPTLSLA